MRFLKLFSTNYKSCKKLIAYIINWNLITNHIRIYWKIPHYPMASNRIKTTNKPNSISPTWNWLWVRCRNDRWSNNNQRNNFSFRLILLWFLMCKKHFLSHTLTITIIVWKFPNNFILVSKNINLTHTLYFLKLFTPSVLSIFIHPFVNESYSFRNCIKSRHLAKNFHFMALFRKFH